MAEPVCFADREHAIRVAPGFSDQGSVQGMARPAARGMARRRSRSPLLTLPPDGSFAVQDVAVFMQAKFLQAPSCPHFVGPGSRRCFAIRRNARVLREQVFHGERVRMSVEPGSDQSVPQVGFEKCLLLFSRYL